MGRIINTITKNKKRVVLISVIMIVVVFAIVAFLIINKNHKQYNLYFDAIAENCDMVDEYNNTVDLFSTCVGEYDKSYVGELKAYSKIEKNEAKAFFPEYTFSGPTEDEIGEIKLGTEEVKKKKDQIITNIANLKNYISVVNDYNSAVENYNGVMHKYIELLNEESEGDSVNQTGAFEEKKTIEINEIDKIKVVFEDTLINELKASTQKLNEVSEYASKNNDLAIEYFQTIDKYNEAIRDYNAVAEEYNTLLAFINVGMIDGISSVVEAKTEMKLDPSKYLARDFFQDEIDSFKKATQNITDETAIVLSDYIYLGKVVNPTQSYIENCLTKIDDIADIEAVTKDNDSTGMYGKEGCFTSCIYFTLNEIEVNQVVGDTVVEKGTDAGGAIEVYKNGDEAMARCEYLSEFDNTVLDPGSYAILGTVVIRTSYKLSEERQYEITNLIANKLLED